MYKLLFLFFVFSLSSTETTAQNDTLKPHFISYNDKITVGMTYQNSSNSFTIIHETDSETKKVAFTPNTKERISFDLSYKFIDVSIGYAPKFLQKEDAKYDSKNFNLGFRFNYKNWYQSLTFIEQRGFFVSYDDLERMYLPYLKSQKIGGKTSYVFNDNFSYKTVFNQYQWQKKSSGSFVANFSLYYTNLSLNEEFTLANANVYSITLAPAYYYNWVINQNFLISIGLIIGAGANIEKKQTTAIYEFSSTFKLGYNRDAYFFYLDTNGTSFLQEAKNVQFDDSFVSARLVVGYRFDPPRGIKKAYDKTLGRIGL